MSPATVKVDGPLLAVAHHGIVSKFDLGLRNQLLRFEERQQGMNCRCELDDYDPGLTITQSTTCARINYANAVPSW